MFHAFTDYFTDAVLRAPTIGCMLMCMTAALVGVIVFLKKRSLLGESLSHAAYPGVIMGVIFAGALDINESKELPIALFVMGGAFVSAFFGLWAIDFLQKHMGVRSDSALCFVLAAFFGIGLTLASQVQFAYSSLYRQVQVYLYGQAATMTDVHIAIYGALAFVTMSIIILFHKEIQGIAFDSEYIRSIGINKRIVDTTVFFLTVLAVVVGIRSVGVVLMSAMLIAPAAAARQYSNHLNRIFALAAIFGIMSGFFGNYLSVEISNWLSLKYPNERLTLPTGPMIVVVASFICLFSLMFAPNRGLLLRLGRIMLFRYRCMCENMLKAIWREGPNKIMTFDEIVKHQSASLFYLHYILFSLVNQGWVEKVNGGYHLTQEGIQWAARIVRLHRLWEVYLVDYLGVGAERVHRSAEEMEHILNPELEAELTLLLKDPRHDPHQQPIPQLEK
jgi:manganese/zinc/iron transport system permease protein